MNLHAEIINISADATKAGTDDPRQAYLIGHRDARHAAAELSLAVAPLIDALHEIAAKDPAALANDPLWAQQLARIALADAGTPSRPALLGQPKATPFAPMAVVETTSSGFSCHLTEYLPSGTKLYTIPPGWKLAPEIPTPTMKSAGALARHSAACDGGYSTVGGPAAEAAFIAMMAVVPNPGQPG